MKNNKTINISSYLREMAKKFPYKRAVVCPVGKDKYGHTAYTHLTFHQLDQESDRVALSLERIGIGRGIRTILMVKPSLDFFIIIFALFKTGAVPVVVDPGMGLKRMIGCLNESRPQGFIGIPLAHLVRICFPAFFKTVKIWVTVGHRWFWGGHTFKKLIQKQWEPYPEIGRAHV